MINKRSKTMGKTHVCQW